MSSSWATIVTDRQLRSWRQRGMTTARIAELVGATPQDVVVRIKEIFRRSQANSEFEEDVALTVDPAEEAASEASLRLAPLVAAEAAAIQARWTASDERNHRVVRGRPIELIEMSDVRRQSHV